MPDNDGLSLYLNAKSLAWNDWEDVINHALKQTQTDPNGDLKKMNLNQIVANVTHFDYDGMLFENVRINAIANSQQAWSGSLSSDLFNGHFKWKPADVKEHSQLWADFDYLKIPKKKLSKKSLDLIPQTTETLPSMDIRVDQLTFDNYNLGEFSISTRNHGLGEEQYWTLEQLILKNDDAKLMVNGLWNSGKKSQSQTNLSATLDINDLGNVLERAHLQHVINDGHGQINLDLNWSGAPIDFNAQNLNGKVSTQLFSGQFLQVEPGAGRLLSLISLQQLFRRFALDFRDVVGQGFVFDSISGSIDIVKGLATTDSLRIVGPQATILSQGWLDLKTLTQKVKISVLPDINLSGASIALAVANPLLGVGSFLAQLALQAPLSQLFSIEYEISGSLDAPVIQKVKNDDRNIEEAQTP